MKMEAGLRGVRSRRFEPLYLLLVLNLAPDGEVLAADILEAGLND